MLDQEYVELNTYSKAVLAQEHVELITYSLVFTVEKQLEFITYSKAVKEICYANSFF